VFEELSYPDSKVTSVDGALAVLDRAVQECRSTPVWAVPRSTLVDSLDHMHALIGQMTAIKLEWIREVDGQGIAVEQGATNTATWLRDRHRISAAAATLQVKLAAALHHDLPATAEALAAGVVNVEQVRVIASAVADLPVEYRGAGERHLVGEAGSFGPRELGVLGQRLFEVIAPDEADKQAQAALTRSEERAYQGRDLRLSDVAGDSRVRLTGWLDRESAAQVRAALDPLCAPRTAGPARPTGPGSAGPGSAWPESGGPGSAGPESGGSGSGGSAGPAVVGEGADRRTPGQRRADALVEICRIAMACGKLPDNGGDRPQVVVTVNLDTLRSQLGAAMLDDATPLDATTARRLACDAALLPAVLGSAGQVLDLGRERRLFTGPIRRALVLRDRGCAFPGCDRPPRWTDGHHITHWADGGPTNLTNAVLLCGYHHRLIHHSDWQIRINPADGQPEFIPPAYIDPHQKPQRNRYHRRE
jgi:hypothetical protein